MEGGRENADDLVGLAVGDDSLTDYIGIAGKFSLPIAVTDDDGVGGAGFGVFGAEEAAELGSDGENGEDAVADAEGLNLFWFPATGDAEGISGVSANIGEAAVLLAVDEIVGWSHVEFGNVDAGGVVPDADEFFWLGVGERLEEDAFEDGEDGGVGAVACGEGDESDDGEERGTAEAAEELFEGVGE